VKRVAGSLGVALLVGVLEHRVPGGSGSGAVADRAAPASTVFEAFAATFWWVLALSALAQIPLCYRGARRQSARREHAPTAGIGTSTD
jgi:hypothetical protein